MSHMGLDMAAGHDRVPAGAVARPEGCGYLSAGTRTNVPLANEATSLPGNGLPRRTAFSRFRREKSRRRDLPRAPENWVWMLRGQSKYVLERRCRGKPTLGFDSATRYARSAHGDRNAHFLRQLGRDRHVVSPVMPWQPTLGPILPANDAIRD
jgi:hypothetical protein